MLPILRTRQLELRSARSDDLEALWGLLTQPEVRRYLCDDVVLTREQVGALLAESLTHADAGLGLWMIQADEVRPIGCVGLQPVSGAAATIAPGLAGEVEPLVALVPTCWRRGFATEALAAVLTYGFGVLRLPRVVALVDLPNTASHRLLQRLAFRTLGEIAGSRHRLRVHKRKPPG
jgi:ribosomal-protein-alanine N-acetyltransferase